MEEAKAAAYYDELNRKGEGARRFKQGLGFSSSSSSFPPSTSKPSSSLLSGFVRAGAGASTTTPSQPSNLSKPPPRPRHRSRSPSPSRHPSPSRSRSRSPSPSRHRHPSQSRWRRSRSRSRERRGSRRRSPSPTRRSSRSSHSGGRRDGGDRGSGGRESSKGQSGRGGGKLDYAQLIEGYDRMTPAERVKAKMKLQLSSTAAKDASLGGATGWERFDFNKDAPLDEDDDETEVADDDASLVKGIGKSFRLSAVESKREDQVMAAHDEAMFGVPTYSVLESETVEPERENVKRDIKTDDDEKKTADVDKVLPAVSPLISETMASQGGSWRDRVQKLRGDKHN